MQDWTGLRSDSDWPVARAHIFRTHQVCWIEPIRTDRSQVCDAMWCFLPNRFWDLRHADTPGNGPTQSRLTLFARSLEEFFLLVRTSIIIRYVIRKNEDLPSSKVPSYLLACSVTFVSFFVSQIPVVFVQNGCRQPEHIFRKFRGSIKQKFLAGH
jgi:hypothetical protein